ncbi:MAG: hypothetical protein PVG32_08110 [Anaerolineales bacterium]|jgi:hypothetical protein
MDLESIPPKAQQTLLQDASERDRTTARRVSLLNILINERFLTRAGLIARTEARVGQGCFGEAAWKDTFYRDMRVVKEALQRAGYELAYSRRKGQSGYYLRGQPQLNSELVHIIEGSIAELNQAQIIVYRQLDPADRFRQGCSVSDTARGVVAHRIQLRQPELSSEEANRLALEQRHP